MSGHSLSLLYRGSSNEGQRYGRMSQAMSCQLARVQPCPEESLLYYPADTPSCERPAIVAPRGAGKERSILFELASGLEVGLDRLQGLRHEEYKLICIISAFAMHIEDSLALLIADISYSGSTYLNISEACSSHEVKESKVSEAF